MAHPKKGFLLEPKKYRCLQRYFCKMSEKEASRGEEGG